MHVKDFLERALDLDGAIDAQIAELTHLRELSLKIGTSKLEERVTRSAPKEAPFAKWVERIVDKEREIDEEIDRLVAIKLDISNYVDKISDLQQQCVLRYRYVLCKPWVEIAGKMQCSVSKVKRIHKNFLENLKNDTI